MGQQLQHWYGRASTPQSLTTISSNVTANGLRFRLKCLKRRFSPLLLLCQWLCFTREGFPASRRSKKSELGSRRNCRRVLKRPQSFPLGLVNRCVFFGGGCLRLFHNPL